MKMVVGFIFIFVYYLAMANMKTMHMTFKQTDFDYFSLALKATACVLGVATLQKLYNYTIEYLKIRKLRREKLHQLKTLKEKMEQKLVGLKKPIDNRDALPSLSYENIHAQLYNNKLSAIDLLEAYQAKALHVDKSLNCITDLVHDADVKAVYLDSLPRYKRGSLHGIPLSVQESVCQMNFDSYYGCISRCFLPNTSTAHAVQALMTEGMIPFARTNMSQCGITIDGNNPLFGETLNPHNCKRTCGGSSGGEGALIGGKGSMAGIGTDVIGGMRIPASFCGIYCLKPTCDRIGRHNTSPFKYQLKPLAYHLSVGPMTSDLNLLIDMTRVLFSNALFDLDDSIPKLCFDEANFQCRKQLKIGYYKSFSNNYFTFEPSFAVKRGVAEAKSVLERRGHIVVEWEPPKIAYACDLQLRCLFFDGGERARRLRNDELFLSSSVESFCLTSSLSNTSKFLLSLIFGYIKPLFARHLRRKIPPRNPHEMIMLMEEANAYKEECAKAWKEADLDALICPILPFTAPLIGDSHELIYGALYTNIFNFLDYPAGVMPISKVTQEDLNGSHSVCPRRSPYASCVETQPDSVGLPIGVQCVAKKWQDETVLKVMKEIQMGLASTRSTVFS